MSRGQPLRPRRRAGASGRSPGFEADVATLVARAGARLAYLMVPKVRGAADLQRACARHRPRASRARTGARGPVHALIETHGALREVAAMAAHPRIESLSFGLMDFVSAHRGAIPASAMSAAGQFAHPLVVRAKLEIAAACHAHGKTPSHCVVTEFKTRAPFRARPRARVAPVRLHAHVEHPPDQIAPIVEAFAPSAAEIDQAIEICWRRRRDWAPIRHRDTLHDRASYRYFWQVLERAHRTGAAVAGERCENASSADPPAA